MTTTKERPTRDSIGIMIGIGILTGFACLYGGLLGRLFWLKSEHTSLVDKIVIYTEFADREQGISRSDKDDLAGRLLQAEHTLCSLPPPSSHQLADNPYRVELNKYRNLESALHFVHNGILREVFASYQK
ncbi:MAG: hypothetical protein Q8L34_05080 [Candidatus Woesearchaeota archaeon]|nr:hypothetical protein [Candidatus Woesearchaeota archaeon]